MPSQSRLASSAALLFLSSPRRASVLAPSVRTISAGASGHGGGATCRCEDRPAACGGSGLVALPAGQEADAAAACTAAVTCDGTCVRQLTRRS